MSTDAPATLPGTVAVPLRRPGASAVVLDDNVAVYDDVGQLLILLNAGAASIWERCDGTTPLEDLAGEFAAAHPGAPADVAEDVRRTVAKLAELGLVVDAGG